MSLAVIVTVLVVLVNIFLYWWLRTTRRILGLMKWVPQVPGNFLLGNGLDFSDSTSFLKRMSEYIQRFGRVVLFRIGTQNILLVTDHDLLEFILSSNVILTKSENYKFLKSWLGNGLLVSTGDKWRERRKIITPTFHFKILEQFVEVFEAQAEILVKKLEQELGKDSFNVQPYITLCTLDIICETAMGTSINAQDNKNLNYVAAVKTMCKMIVTRGFSPILMYDFLYKMSSEYTKEKNALQILHSHTDAVIASKRKELQEKGSENTEKQDEFGIKKRIAFLDMLLQSTVNGRKLNDSEIREEVDTFMFEGHDTTTSAISFALHLISKHQDVQEKIVEEQNEVLGENPETITLKDLGSMKYLECVVKEVLRLYPSVPFYARKVTKDIEYKGNILPKNMTLFIYAYGANRDPEYFPDPEKFNPSRFEDYNSKLPFAYIPFSAGPRNCIGQKFAMLEMKSTISAILRHFKILPAIPEHNPILVGETVLNSRNGINVRLERRK